MSKEEIREYLIAKGENLFKMPRQKTVDFTGEAGADALLSDLKYTPHAFVIGCVMDRQIKAERAWLIPFRLTEKLGTFEFSKLRELDLPKVPELMKPLHFRYNEMSLNLVSALELIDTRYKGKASRIWEGQPSSATVVYRFLEFRGIGPKIATMAANILARRFKVPFSDYHSIDISPDVHVRRVFERLGLIRKKASVEELIYSARALNPKFPGIPDFPVWQIGRQWCKPRRPVCPKCDIKDLCPSVEILYADSDV